MRASVVQGKLVLEAIPTLEEVLRKPVAKIEVRKAERMSEEARREHGILG